MLPEPNLSCFILRIEDPLIQASRLQAQYLLSHQLSDKDLNKDFHLSQWLSQKDPDRRFFHADADTIQKLLVVIQLTIVPNNQSRAKSNTNKENQIVAKSAQKYQEANHGSKSQYVYTKCRNIYPYFQVSIRNSQVVSSGTIITMFPWILTEYTKIPRYNTKHN